MCFPDYICHKIISNKDINCRAEVVKYLESKNLHQADKKACRLLQDLSSRFEKKYREDYSSHTSELSTMTVVTSCTQDARYSFDAVVAELFQEGWRWPRVIALFAYVGLLAEATAASVQPVYAIEERLGEVIDWTLELLMSEKASIFFRENNGWVRYNFYYLIFPSFSVSNCRKGLWKNMNPQTLRLL